MALGEEIVDLSEALLKATHAALLAHLGEEVAKHAFSIAYLKQVNRHLAAIKRLQAKAIKEKEKARADKLKAAR